MTKLPKFLKKYFWDVDFRAINFEERRVFILRRLLDYGDEKAVSWVYKYYKPIEMKNVLQNFRGLSQKSANFWAFLLGVSKKDVLCLKKRLLKAPKAIWSY